MPILFGITILELIFLFLFVIAMTGTCFVDRRGGSEGAKWVCLFIGLGIVAAWTWSDFSVDGIWASVRTLEFWKPFGIYLAVGLAYAMIEFVLEVRRTEQVLAKAWKRFLGTKQTIRASAIAGGPGKREVLTRDLVDEGRRDDASPEAKATLHTALLEYRSSIRLSDHKLINLIVEADGTDLKPTIDKSELADHISAWTTLWPFYALSLFLGEFLTGLWSSIAHFFMTISGRFVRAVFSNTFRI